MAYHYHITQLLDMGPDATPTSVQTLVSELKAIDGVQDAYLTVGSWDAVVYIAVDRHREAIDASAKVTRTAKPARSETLVTLHDHDNVHGPYRQGERVPTG